MHFYLMNKDNIVLEFNLERTVLGLSYSIVGEVMEVLPRGLKDFSEWVKSRYIFSHRNDITLLFRQLGINKLEDYLDITNCISITDTFWVKSVDSKKSWRNVSPYCNSLNKTIAEFSFTGKVNGKYITGSPDLSTGGNFPKCWKKNNGEIYLYKAGTSGAFNAGYEPYSEVFAYQLANYLGLDCVEYKYALYKGKDVSVCKNMCSESVGLISLRDMLDDDCTDFEKLLSLYRERNN